MSFRSTTGSLPLVGLAAALALAACASTPAERVAPFRERPDSTDAGALRGPFTGEVVDASTGNPVEDAVVYATWSFVSGYGDQVPAGYREHTTSTDLQGRYQIPALEDAPEDARLSAAYVVIYKPGYVAYRSDRRFSDLGLRRDFAQRRNRVELARWRPGYSHVRHVRFIGGGEELVRLTADERARAAAELTGDLGQAPPVEPVFEPVPERPEGGPDGEPVEPSAPAADAPRAAELLTAELVESITGDQGPFETGPLGDQPDTATYSSQHIRAVDREEAYDVALRLWAEGADGARTRYEALEASLPEAQATGEIADRAFRTEEPGLYGVAFLDEGRGVAGLLVCGEGLCPDGAVAVEIAEAVYAGIAGEGDGDGEGETETEGETEAEGEDETEAEGEDETEAEGEDETETEAEAETESEGVEP